MTHNVIYKKIMIFVKHLRKTAAIRIAEFVILVTVKTLTRPQFEILSWTDATIPESPKDCDTLDEEESSNTPFSCLFPQPLLLLPPIKSQKYLHLFYLVSYDA